jgi:hypothetical protein
MRIAYLLSFPLFFVLLFFSFFLLFPLPLLPFFFLLLLLFFFFFFFLLLLPPLFLLLLLLLSLPLFYPLRYRLCLLRLLNGARTSLRCHLKHPLLYLLLLLFHALALLLRFVVFRLALCV